MDNFKFFQGNDDNNEETQRDYGFGDYTYDGTPLMNREDINFIDSDPSWMWCQQMGITDLDSVDIVVTTCNGIREFLTRFPRFYIVPIVSISGLGITHTVETENLGWSFDVQRDELTFVYVRV